MSTCVQWMLFFQNDLFDSKCQSDLLTLITIQFDELSLVDAKSSIGWIEIYECLLWKVTDSFWSLRPGSRTRYRPNFKRRPILDLAIPIFGYLFNPLHCLCSHLWYLYTLREYQTFGHVPLIVTDFQHYTGKSVNIRAIRYTGKDPK